MNRYLPCLTALLLSLPLLASAADSNRVADGGSEPASAWIKVRYTTKDGLNHEYWCHASDCDAVRGKAASKKNNRVKNTAYLAVVGPYMEHVPLYTLWPAKDAMVSLPTFRAVKAPVEIEELDYDENTSLPDRAFFGFDGPGDKRCIGTFDMNATVANGNIVVLADEGSENGKPMSLSTTGDGKACESSDYYLYYDAAAGDNQLLDKAFSPMEFDLERAQLWFFMSVARVHSGTLKGRDFKAIAAETNLGNLRIADEFVTDMRQSIRTAAQGYLMQSPSYTVDELDAFEQRFLLCMMGYTGKQAEFRDKLFAAQSNPSQFTQSWRRFIQTEVKRYVDAPQPAGFSNKDAVANKDWKPDWDQLNTDAVSWLNTGALPAPPAPPQPVAPPPPVVVPKHVDPPPASPATRTRPAQPAPVTDDPDADALKILHGGK